MFLPCFAPACFELFQPANDDGLQSNAMIGEAVIGRDSYLFERDGTLLSQRRRQSFHISMILIVGFEEQHGTRAQGLRPLHIIPIFRMPFGLSKKLLRSGSTYRMQLRFPALQ